MKKKIICYYNRAYKSSIEKKFTKIPLMRYKPNLKNKKKYNHNYEFHIHISIYLSIYIYIYIYIYE